MVRYNKKLRQGKEVGFLLMSCPLIHLCAFAMDQLSNDQDPQNRVQYHTFQVSKCSSHICSEIPFFLSNEGLTRETSDLQIFHGRNSIFINAFNKNTHFSHFC